MVGVNSWGGSGGKYNSDRGTMVLEPTHSSSLIRSLEDGDLIHLARALDNEVSMIRFESIFIK